MLNSMTWDQLRGWFDYYQIDPFGEERADLRSGIIASTIANVNRDPRKGKPYGPRDFMPKLEESDKEDRKPITDQQQWQAFKARAIRLSK